METKTETFPEAKIGSLLPCMHTLLYSRSSSRLSSSDFFRWQCVDEKLEERNSATGGSRAVPCELTGSPKVLMGCGPEQASAVSCPLTPYLALTLTSGLGRRPKSSRGREARSDCRSLA